MSSVADVILLWLCPQPAIGFVEYFFLVSVQTDKTKILKTNCSLMNVESLAECSL